MAVMLYWSECNKRRMKDWVSSGSLEMSDIMKSWGVGSIWIEGGHWWDRARDAAARSRRVLMRGMVGEAG
jgi:hypothetical protein